MSKYLSETPITTPTTPSSPIVLPPFPYGKVATVALSVFINNVSMQMVYPFIPFMVKDFFPELPDSQLGFKAGTLGSAFNIGQFCGSILWSYIADLMGRRFALLSGIVGTFISTIVFGFSWSYMWAIFARFLWGLLNGNIGVAKTYLSEILINEHQSKGFTTIGTMDALGRIAGPALGGFLGDKKNIEPITDRISLIKKFPYLVACSICAIFSLIGLAISYISIDETLTPEIRERMKQKKKERESKDSIYCDDDDDGISKKKKNLISKKIKKNKSKRSNYSWITLLTTRDIMIACLIYGIAAVHGSAIDEVVPLYLLNSKEDGGFEFTSSEIGMLYTISSPIQMIGLLFFYPYWVSKFGYRNGIMINAIIVSLVTYFFPLISYFNNISRTYVWFILCPAIGLLQTFRVMCFTTSMVLINNSCLPEQKSKGNGIGQTMAGIARSIGPLIGSNLLAWSLNNTVGGIFNERFTFMGLSFCHILIFFFSYILPLNIEYKKTYEDVSISSLNSIEMTQPNSARDATESSNKTNVGIKVDLPQKSEH